jgi:serine O-acetyltransferase
MLFKVLSKISYFIYKYYQDRFYCEIYLGMKVGKSLYLPHLNGIIIHPKVIIGDSCTILQQVTIGNNGNKGLNNLAKINNNVSIGAGAKIIGPCVIEEGVSIGANSVVIKNIKANCVAAGIPAKVLYELKK